MRIMAFGHGQIVHVRVEVMVALGTAVLGVFENDVARSSGKWVSQIVQSPANGSKSVGTALAQRTGPPFIVAAALHKPWSRQILNTCDSLCFICYIFAWPKHLDNLQHRFKFLYWNIGTWTQDTSKKLCIAATVSKESHLPKAYQAAKSSRGLSDCHIKFIRADYTRIRMSFR